MAAGDINDALSNIPWITVQDKVADPADQGAGFAPIYVKNGVLMWLPHSGSAQAAMSNPMTTLDDLILGGASGVPARLAKGTDSQVLTVDPASHHPAWATPSSGAFAIVTDGHVEVGGGGSASVTLPSSGSIPATYHHLQIVWQGVCTDAGVQDVRLIFNADTGNNYDYSQHLAGQGSHSATSARTGANILVGATVPSGQANLAASGVIHIPNYAGAFYKTLHALSHRQDTLADGNHMYAMQYGGMWRNTAAITSITLTPSAGSWGQYSTFTLYGLS
jgi:hypothetical protein